MILAPFSGGRRSDNGDPEGAADLVHCEHDLVRAAHSALVLRRIGHLEEAAAEENKATAAQALLDRLNDPAPTAPPASQIVGACDDSLQPVLRPPSDHGQADRTPAPAGLVEVRVAPPRPVHQHSQRRLGSLRRTWARTAR